MKFTGARIKISFIILIIVCLGLLVLNICIGSVTVSLSQIWESLFGGSTEGVEYNIIMQIRLPRALAALFLGGALALAGYLLQNFFHNPIAGPFVLGISSGAKMVVAITMILTLKHGISISSMTMVLAAFVGSMISMGFVLLISRAVDKMSMLIVAGVMIGYICSAITDFIVTFADDSNIVNLHNWSLGSFSGTSWQQVQVIAVMVMLCALVVFCLSKPMAAYQLGEEYARNMGVNIRVFRFLLVILSSLLAACVTAFAGPISFVGIAVPHLIKNLLRSTKPILMIPACFLGGGIFCLLCDLLSRVIFSPTEVSVSSMTAVFGAPVVIYIMMKRKR